MHSPVKNHFHPRGNVYGITPPKYPWAQELSCWLAIGAVVWVLWHLA